MFEVIQGHLVTGQLLVHSSILAHYLENVPAWLHEYRLSGWPSQSERRRVFQAMEAVLLHFKNRYLPEDITVWRFSLWLQQIKAFGPFWVLIHHKMSNSGKPQDAFLSSVSSSEWEMKGKKETLEELLDALGFFFPEVIIAGFHSVSRGILKQVFLLHTCFEFEQHLN